MPLFLISHVGGRVLQDDDKRRQQMEAKAKREAQREQESQAKMSKLTDKRIELGQLIRQRHRELLQACPLHAACPTQVAMRRATALHCTTRAHAYVVPWPSLGCARLHPWRVVVLQVPRCQLCVAPMTKLRRLAPCKHIVCEACAEEEKLAFFHTCPKCRQETLDDAILDVTHESIIAERMSSLKQMPDQMTNERARLEKLVQTRDKKNLYVLEYGSVSKEGACKGYIRVVNTLEGANAELKLPEGTIQKITMGVSVTEHTAIFTQPNDKEFGFCIPLPASSKVCVMTIHWASSLWMAPLQIRYKRESHEGRELWRKRVCVQFAQSTGAELSGGIKTTVGKFSKENLEATEGGVPIELLSDAKETFDGAMVIYKPGLNGTRSQASIESRTWRPEHEQRVYRKGVAPTPRGGEASDAASKWLDKMIDDTNDRVQELLGDVRDVQTALVKGASEGMPLKEIPFQVKDDHHGRFVPTEDDQYNMRQKMPPDIPMRMLEGICSADAKLVEKIYADLASIFKDPVVKKALGSIMAERVRSDLDRPASFFQVAIDLPGFGATEDLLGKDELMSANFLKEVITSLSKEHAFAIVVETHAADALFQVLFEAPKITSFIAVRQPILEETEPERLTRIIHPVFVPWDPRTASAYVQTARKLNEFLPDGASLKVSLAKVPSFYNVELGTELVSFFAKHNWHGMMNSDGTSR